MKRLEQIGFTLAFPTRRASHEFIITLKPQAKASGVSALDVAKRLLDYGFHAPTQTCEFSLADCTPLGNCGASLCPSYLHKAGEFHRVAAAAAEGAPLDQMRMQNLHLFGRLILQMGTQARHAALKRVLHHLKKSEFDEALFTLRLVSLGSGGAFSNMERKQLTELIESVMPPDVKARLDETADRMEGEMEDEEGSGEAGSDQQIGPMPTGRGRF